MNWNEQSGFAEVVDEVAKLSAVGFNGRCVMSMFEIPNVMNSGDFRSDG